MLEILGEEAIVSKYGGNSSNICQAPGMWPLP